MMFIWMNAIMLSNAIKMAEAMKPFMPTKEVKEPKMLKHGNWERRVIPMPEGKEDSRR